MYGGYLVVLATLWVPSLEVVSPASINSLIAVLLLGILSSRVVPDFIRIATQYLAPFILLIAAGECFFRIYPARSFPGLSEYLGYYFLLGAGMGYALHHLHYFASWRVFLGYVSFLGFGTLILIDIHLKWFGNWDFLERLVDRYPAWTIGTILTYFVFVQLVCIKLIRYFHRRTYRARHGLCLQCAYDLQGNPEASHCPECGTLCHHQ